MLLAYNLIRREATKVAEKHKKAASEISFKFAFQFIATDNDSAGKHGVTRDHPETTGASAGALEVVFITKRPRPSRTMAIKISKTRYPVKRSAAPLK